MTTKQKIKHEIELLKQLKEMAHDNKDIAFGANVAYELMIDRLTNLIK